MAFSPLVLHSSDFASLRECMLRALASLVHLYLGLDWPRRPPNCMERGAKWIPHGLAFWAYPQYCICIVGQIDRSWRDWNTTSDRFQNCLPHNTTACHAHAITENDALSIMSWTVNTVNEYTTHATQNCILHDFSLCPRPCTSSSFQCVSIRCSHHIELYYITSSKTPNLKLLHAYTVLQSASSPLSRAEHACHLPIYHACT
jgi:hypothetical protein